MEGEFYRETWVEIQLDAISKNIQNIRDFLPKETKIMAVVKADGYGHGALEVAKVALQSGAKQLAVAMLDEAVFLRNHGIEAPILVLGYCPPEYAKIAEMYDIALTVYQTDWLRKVKPQLNRGPLHVHVKCDTGMGRIGVRDEEEFKNLIHMIHMSREFQLEGIFTHFAKADSKDSSYYRKQLDKFIQCLETIDSKPKWIHAGNSAASLLYEDSLFNMVRIGIAMYGLSPSPEIKKDLPISLHEAFSLHSKLIHVKKVGKGAKIGYGCTYTAEEEEWIGTIPIGYADGWLRALQGQTVLIDGERAPIVGRICMDQCMVKLPKRYPVGTRVTLIGKQGTEKISVDEIAEKLNTINYEVVCLISERVPRVYKIGEKTIKKVNKTLC
ncbi:alanine racemase [Fervidibacillus halotolerans]|uniref:Alanine racemase n=1 Tax=Fervidibacillus halotolerans TaxID=2980027 RepID=A0A9E8M212_9BACI|nr:alanine racemase [Fervidibacillus halotolerans]WAA14020.1 alanine racemase [Fervidibacillus halotolerans]